MKRYTLEGVFNKILTTVWKFRYKNSFKYLGRNSYVKLSIHIKNPENIYIGENVSIGYKTWLSCTNQTGQKDPELNIGNGTYVGNFNHIYSTKSISIGENVLIADKVYISDNRHSYEDISMPVINQPIKQLNPVQIGDGSWIGENASIIGCKIGKNCVVGANALVTKDIPDYCVAVGTPARVIRKFDFSLNRWVKVP